MLGPLKEQQHLHLVTDTRLLGRRPAIGRGDLQSHRKPFSSSLAVLVSVKLSNFQIIIV